MSAAGASGMGQGPGEDTHLMRFSKNSRALLKICKRERRTSAAGMAEAPEAGERLRG